MENSLEQRLITEARIGGDLECLIKLFRIYQRNNRQLYLNKGGYFARVTAVEDGTIAIDVLDFLSSESRLMNPFVKAVTQVEIETEALLCDDDCLGWRLRTVPSIVQEYLELRKDDLETS